jgi:uncharacterized small protein (DUF1192 family)
MNEEMNEKTNDQKSERASMNENPSTAAEARRMGCVEFEDALDDLDRAGTPGLAQREAALAHAEGCSRCAQLMTDNEALDFSLQLLAVREAEAQAPPRVEAALLQEMRRHKAERSRRSQWRIAALGIAATVLLAAGLAVRHLPFNGARGGNVADISNAGNPAAGANAGAPVEVAENVSTDTQDESAFISLPYATDPGEFDSGTVVRVELTRAALASMGMPVTDVGATDRIPADILLSEDGAPQAIRLVSAASLDQ